MVDGGGALVTRDSYQGRQEQQMTTDLRVRTSSSIEDIFGEEDGELSKRFQSRKNRCSVPSKSLPGAPSRAVSSFKRRPSAWSVYLIVSSRSPRTYVGVTTNFARRLKQHNGELKGGAKASSAGRPWTLACIIRGFRNQSEGIYMC
ncbi:hypothetical protein J5N97_017594 [Dioscorea zingiberensis]|uniref:GIY-YIG domain-containing protein n=1 Tax=Dioscorea zingiberensis TaxID=325984 RepID=A0A9D5CMA8_9LILI|nr:hypothetical protein J5N97_017594 [Dioscorea zingiberensis]